MGPLHRLERSFLSLAGCYALLASLAVLFLAYARVAFLPNSADLSSLTNPFSGAVPRWRVWLDLLREVAYALRERLHTTWLFFGVFAAVWLACLLWMQIERSRRDLRFNWQEAIWIAWMSVAVFSASVLYALGTKGVFPLRRPQLVTVSDVLALALIALLPLIVWSRLRRQQLQFLDAYGEFDDYRELDDFDEPGLQRRSSGFLGLDNARLTESLSLRERRPEVRPVEMSRTTQLFQERPAENASATADRLIKSPESPVIAKLLESAPSLVTFTPISDAAEKLAPKGIDGFRSHLSTMNSSWQKIETIRREIDDWFEQRRQQAIAHLDAHPGMRGSTLAQNLFNDFPNDKLSAVDAEWAEIRRSTLEISRWFGDVPASDRNR